MTRASPKLESLRLGILTALMLASLFFLAGALWRVQISRGEHYARNAQRQSLRLIRVPADRGRIFDRGSICLADNVPSFSLCVFVEEFRKPGRWDFTADAVARQLKEVSAVVGLPIQLSAADFTNHVRRRLPLPLVAWTNLTIEVMARFAENQWRFRGIDIVATPSRIYPHGGLGAHLLGYVGKADLAADQKRGYDYLLPEWEGRSGLERRLESKLAGQPGRRLVRVDASGFMSGVVQERVSEPGRDLILTVDARIQGMAETALDSARGAVVVMDPSNGDVLAMASSPGFDPNVFVPGVSRDQWSAMTAEDSGRPLLNRAIGGLYPPGSLFKPVVAIAGLENRLWDPDARVTCPGYFELGRMRIRCWNTYGHGAITLRKAIEQSCNVYFCTLGTKIGYEAIAHMAGALGLGIRTGVELDGELPGLIPDLGWKRKRFGDAWRNGDTANASIGQGFLGVTPLQMAVMCAAIANGGQLYKPRLILGFRERGGAMTPAEKPVLVRELNWSARTREVVRGGMRDVVNAPSGTGTKAKLEQVVVAAKTGTAEVGVKGGGHKQTWMMAFAPFDAPRYALAMVVEEGDSGGSTVGPRVGRLLKGIFEETEAGG